MLWLLLWTSLLRLFGKITGAISTTVHAQFILGLWETFMGTWRWYRMIRVVSFYKLLSEGTSSGLTPSLSTLWLRSQCLPFQGFRFQIFWSLLAWMIFWTSLMHILRLWASTSAHQDRFILSPALATRKDCSTQSVAHCSSEWASTKEG